MQKTKVVHRGNNIGDMRHRVILHTRSIRSPAFGSVDFNEDFEGIHKWAAIQTLGGKMVFGGVGQDPDIATHAVFIRYCDVSSQNFIQVDDGRRFKILQSEDYDERHEYIKLLCTDRGFDEAAKS